MENRLLTQELSMKDLKPSFLSLFEPVSDLFEADYMDALTQMRGIIDKMLVINIRKDREKFNELSDALTENLDWLSRQSTDNIIENDSDLCLFNDDYEITFVNDIMVIHKSKYYIMKEGHRVPYLGPECFVNEPNVRYVE